MKRWPTDTANAPLSNILLLMNKIESLAVTTFKGLEMPLLCY